MTFKELLDKYQFDEIVSEIRTVWGHRDISLMKMAFDCLKSLPPNTGEGSIDIMIAGDESDPYVRVMGLSEDQWEKGLTKQLNVYGDIMISEKELLAQCLWEITYYGFTPRKTEEKFYGYRNRWVESNDYDKMLHELIDRHFRKKVKPKYRRYLKNGEPGFCARTQEELKKYLFSSQKTNRRKRKAEKRFRDRKLDLERLSRRTELIKKLTRDDSSFTFADLEFILTINIGQEVEYESFTAASSNRATYLEDLILNYADFSDLEVKEVTDIVIFAESSKETPISFEEGEQLKAFMCKLYPFARIHYGQATNDSAGSEILLSLNFINR